MESRFDFIEIQITDFVTDSVDEAAFAINFQINGPGTKVDYLRVSFSDEFIEEYFHITWKQTWKQDLPHRENQLIQEKRDLFVRWAVWRVEQWLKTGRPQQNIRIDLSGPDMIWTKKIEERKLAPVSECKEPHLFVYTMQRQTD